MRIDKELVDPQTKQEADCKPKEKRSSTQCHGGGRVHQTGAIFPFGVCHINLGEEMGKTIFLDVAAAETIDNVRANIQDLTLLGVKSLRVITDFCIRHFARSAKPDQ